VVLWGLFTVFLALHSWLFLFLGYGVWYGDFLRTLSLLGHFHWTSLGPNCIYRSCICIFNILDVICTILFNKTIISSTLLLVLENGMNLSYRTTSIFSQTLCFYSTHRDTIHLQRAARKNMASCSPNFLMQLPPNSCTALGIYSPFLANHERQRKFILPLSPFNKYISLTQMR
jgi:hypothetical protein